MVTYVLGAGASQHAGYPLAADLGNRLYDWVRENEFGWRGFIEALHEQYGGLTGFEQVLTELHERPSGSRAAALSKMSCGNTLGALRVAIPEFFHSVSRTPIQSSDCYKALARDRIGGADAILTFNYDLACERALKAEGLWEIGDGYGFSLGAEITLPSKVRLLKLHGSTNWLGILFDGSVGFSQASNVYGPRPCLFGRRDFTYLGYSNDVHDPHCKHVSTTGGDPALILPTLHKNFFHQTSFGKEWEPFWNHIWWQAQEALRSANKIVIIGYSMPKADERARDLLLCGSNRDAEVCIFSGGDTREISELFRSHGFKNVNSRGRSYFEDFLGV